jgi:hypothetical protein
LMADPHGAYFEGLVVQAIRDWERERRVRE